MARRTLTALLAAIPELGLAHAGHGTELHTHPELLGLALVVGLVAYLVANR